MIIRSFLDTVYAKIHSDNNGSNVGRIYAPDFSLTSDDLDGSVDDRSKVGRPAQGNASNRFIVRTEHIFETATEMALQTGSRHVRYVRVTIYLECWM